MGPLLAFRALGGTGVSQAIDLAAALELIHSATLIHDDINDGGEMRRGRVTAYKKFGLQNALITGDFLFVKAFGIGGKFDAEIVELTADACAALAEGEIRQKRHAFDTNVSHQEYVDIITRKTALPIMAGADRKSTTLNSSHSQISYAVFCLKKKKKTNHTATDILAYYM